MTLIVVCAMGLPGCGKTSLCKGVCESIELMDHIRLLTRSDSCVIRTISFDDIEARLRASTGGKSFVPAAWRDARTRISDEVDALRENSASESPTTLLLLDDNFYYKSMRKRFRPDGIILINRSVDECVCFNASRIDPVPVTVIEHMAMMLEPPSPSSRVPLLALSPIPGESVLELVDTVTSDLGFWQDVIQSAHVGQNKPVQLSREVTHRDIFLNRLEVKLRRCVSAIASKHAIPKECMREISRRKAGMMQNFKHQLVNVVSEESASDLVDSIAIQFGTELVSYAQS